MTSRHIGGSGHIALLILKLSTKWIEWAASGSVCFNTGKRNPCNLLKIMLDEPQAHHNALEKTNKTLPPARISSPDCPACGLITIQPLLSCPLDYLLHSIKLSWADKPCQVFKSLSSVAVWPVLRSWPPHPRVLKQFRFYEVWLSACCPTPSRPEGPMGCFFAWSLTTNCLAWKALPVATLPPVQLGGSLKHTSPTKRSSNP
jgi:hypothetical protein